MTARVAPQPASDGPVRVKFHVQLSRGPKGRRRVRDVEEARKSPVETPVQLMTEAAPKPAPLDPSRVPPTTRLLVLGHHFERLVFRSRSHVNGSDGWPS